LFKLTNGKLNTKRINKIKAVFLLLLVLHFTAFNVTMLCNPVKCCHTVEQKKSEHSCCKEKDKSKCNSDLSQTRISKLSKCGCVHESPEEKTFTFGQSYEFPKGELLTQIDFYFSQPVKNISFHSSENEFRINGPPIYLSFSSLII
jgi:hypothetical protein